MGRTYAERRPKKTIARKGEATSETSGAPPDPPDPRLAPSRPNNAATLGPVNRTLRFGLMFLCLAGSAAAIYNVVADNGDLEKQAEKTACGDATGGCRPQMTRMERTPFAQSFEFATSKGTVAVKCVRAAVLVGDYACTLR
jgi:hypothetical protein